MKKALLLLTSLGMFFSLMAQRVDPLFQDGKIWFKIKDNYAPVSSLTEDPLHLPLGHLPFLSAVLKDHQLRNLSKPFWAAKTSAVLQRTYLLEFDDIYSADLVVKQLQDIPYVEYAEKVPLDHHCLTPNDPSYGSQWGLSIINAPTAWNYFSSGSNVVIAIVDDAVERTHPDLSPNLWVNPGETVNGVDDDGNGYVDDINGWDVGSNDNNPNPPTSSYDHGTHVAGISSARSNNNTGVASIGFSCKLMCIKATNTPTAVTNGYDGIVYAAANGAHIINMSWGGPTFTTTGQNVINYAWSQGCILVAAAGNDNVSSQFYPAAYTNVISVAATTSSDTKASFSNYGGWIDISAPGNNIYSTTVNATYGNKSGTSMASPMVAGLLGLMKSLNPGMPRADLINCLLTTADNINAQNPGYVGQLGSGRIDAAAAMQCVSSSLNNAPVADFVANYTTITAGGQITFTDLSVYNPTSWNWSFPGGTPATYNGQNPPPITYSTAGTYNAVLTVTNANGTDTETKTNYITVNAAGGCYSINYPIPGTWTLNNYYTGATVGQDGWVNGVNITGDREIAMYFDASAQPYNYMTQCWIAFGMAYSANPNKLVPIRIYDGTGGTVGAQIGSTVNLTMGQIMSDEANNYYTVLDFPTPITLPASKRFFVSVGLTNLQWGSGVYDTLSILSNAAGQSSGYPVWERQSNNNWYQYGQAGSNWNLNVSLIVHPFLTNEPVNATFTASPMTICSGDAITFDATGSTYQDTLLWVFPGGNPFLVSEDPNPTVYFDTPGSHTVTMYVIGGGCSELDSAEVTVTVNPTPSVTVTAPQYEICPGGSVVLTATGASSYTWSPGGSLSATTGAVVTASPTTTTTYNIQGTTGSCSGNTTIEIEVLNDPVAVFSASDTTVDCGASVLFDGSSSTDVTDFSWSFTNGSPGTSNASNQSVIYSTPGSQTVDLIVSNACGSDTTSFTVTVLNNCAGVEENPDGIIAAYYNPVNQQVVIGFEDLTAPGAYTLQLLDNLGRTLGMQQIQTGTGNSQYLFDVGAIAPAVYIFRLYNAQTQYSFRFVKQ